MKNRKAVPVLVYLVTGFCLLEYIEFLSGLEPLGISRSMYGLVAGAALFGAACVLSFFRPRWAAICALAGAAVLLPSLWRQFGMALGPSWLWELTHYPNTSAAVVSLVVSSGYAILQLWPLLGSARDTSNRNMIWALGACLSNQFSDYRLCSSSSATTTNCACSSDSWNTRTRS
jgi:hypothetical protein